MRDIAPLLSIAITTLVSVLPWGLPSESRFILPLLPMLGMHIWIMSGTVLPEWLAFMAGLAVDVLTSGPLGFWSLIYIFGYALSSLAAEHVRGGAAVRGLLAFSILATLCSAAWAVSSLYYFEVADWRPFAWTAIAGAALYPLLKFLLALFGPQESIEKGPVFERGV